MIPQASKKPRVLHWTPSFRTPVFARLYRGDRLLIVHFTILCKISHLIFGAEMLEAVDFCVHFISDGNNLQQPSFTFFPCSFFFLVF